VWPGRTPAERTQVLDESTWDGDEAPAFPGGLHYADDKINAFLQGSTQYDGLGHVWYDGKLWNGYDARTTVGGLDKASVNPEGWIFIVDRKKDMINASGYKVWPREVEDVLAEHPAVHESAVVGVPDEKRGETVRAFVSLKPGQTVTPEELIAHCKQRLAAYKYPRSVVLIDELPKTATGKILRRELRE
jgi:acyl-CoA synthetase (AMP-forming)/AMP-acid ligase II